MEERHTLADKDRSGGLDQAEFASAMEKWSASCATAQIHRFCQGNTLVRCCWQSGMGMWARCGTTVGDSSCSFGPHGGYGGGGGGGGGGDMLFEAVDANSDGQARLTEVAGLLQRLGDQS